MWRRLPEAVFGLAARRIEKAPITAATALIKVLESATAGSCGCAYRCLPRARSIWPDGNQAAVLTAHDPQILERRCELLGWEHRTGHRMVRWLVPAPSAAFRFSAHGNANANGVADAKSNRGDEAAGDYLTRSTT